MKIRPVGPGLFDAGERLGRQTDVWTEERDEDNNRISQFSATPKNKEFISKPEANGYREIFRCGI